MYGKKCETRQEGKCVVKNDRQYGNIVNEEYFVFDNVSKTVSHRLCAMK